MAAMGIDPCNNKDNLHLCFSQKLNQHSHDYGPFLGSGSYIDQYEPLNVISWGSYGIVYRARDKKTGEIVAMKKEFHGLSRSTLREIGILMSLPPHASIVEFKQVIQDDGGRVFVVMEYLETDLRRFMDVKRKPFTLSEVKFLMKQIVEGVSFLHENGVMHRDLKPSNILMNNMAQLKICDFGLSRYLGGRTSGWCTSGVGTLWYKAPEILLGARMYTSAIDMWSVGCIMAELVLNEVLFRGKSEVDQIGCIYQFLGAPSNVLRIKFSVAAAFSGAPLLSACGIDLLQRLLDCVPDKRITAKEALNHRWFREYYGLSA